MATDIERELAEHLEHFRHTGHLAARVAAIVSRGALILHPDWTTPEQRAEWQKLQGELRDYADDLGITAQLPPDFGTG